MKVMMIVMHERRAILDRLYESIAGSFEHFELYRLTTAEQENLGKFFKKHDPLDYDRVVISSRLKRLIPQSRLLRLIPGLVFFEYDAWQNYMPESTYFGAYTRFYKQVEGCRVVSSGYQITNALKADGVDAVFVPKGFDDSAISNRKTVRDIPAAFIGSLTHADYRRRADTLNAIAERIPLQIERTDSGEEYVQMLNRIKVFVNADSGMQEYMLKNFEALGAGCILLTENQGHEENAALGFEDMKNVLLYSSVEQAAEKLGLVERDPVFASQIAIEGEALARRAYGFSILGQRIADAIALPMRAKPVQFNVIDRIYTFIFCRWLFKHAKTIQH